MKHKILLILSAVFLTCFLCSSTSDTQGAASASWYINMVDYGMAICQIEPLEGRYKGYNLYVNTEVVSSRR